MTSPTTAAVTGRDGTTIATYRWVPGAAPRAIVQLTHGMGEHLLRYQHLADTLTAAGFLVQGQDHRGHGATLAGEPGHIGATGWAALVDDIDVLVQRAHDEHPDLPLVLLGHSMGSFAAQQYLLDHSADITALALTGTAAIDLLEPVLDLDAPIDLSAFNAPFAPARTDYDWLSRDEAQVDAYIADPLCGFGLDADAGKAMFHASFAVADPDRLARIRKDIPVYIAVGEQDPVNGQLALSNALVQRLEGAGLTDVTSVVWPQARHEILNETNRAEVEADLLAWLDRVVPR
ncbi:MAG: alpha/beta hydrolase [Pseudonocardia sp.]|nr:alpha/beta hydrolase [Pseudonocardia sp.]